MANEQATPTEKSGPTVFKLSAPLKYEDIEKAELVLDLEGLTGDDIAKAESEMQLAGEFTVLADTSKRFYMHIVAKAAGVPVGFIRKMRISDANKVIQLAQNFVMG